MVWITLATIDLRKFESIEVNVPPGDGTRFLTRVRSGQQYDRNPIFEGRRYSTNGQLGFPGAFFRAYYGFVRIYQPNELFIFSGDNASRFEVTRVGGGPDPLIRLDIAREDPDPDP